MEAAIHLESVRSDDMPEGELRRVFAGVKDDLAFEPPRGSEGAIVATLLSCAEGADGHRTQFWVGVRPLEFS